MNERPPAARDGSVILALSGGNALGAYHAGALEALAGRGITPDAVAGTSIGAVMGAIYAGNRADRRLDVLRAFWASARDEWTSDAMAWSGHQSWGAVGRALMLGRPGLFAPNGLWPFAHDHQPGLLSNAPAHASLGRFVDFDILNAAVLPFAAVAVDLATGEEVTFDTRDGRLDERHLRASTAMPVLFAPVEVEGRWLCDGGLSANLPVQQALARIPTGHTLCIALDLFPRQGNLPTSMGDAVVRAQDLVFACQSLQALQRARLEFDLAQRQFSGRPGEPPSVTILHVCYAGEPGEIAGKALDYSVRSIGARWEAGRADLMTALDQFQAMPPPAAGSFNVVRLEGGRLVR